jgi:hypothetical protein
MKNWLFTYTLCLIGLNSFSQNLGYDEANPGSKISIHENLSVGANYSSVAAPTSGAIIQGSVGIGTSAPVSALDVNGGISMGSYAGTTAAPSNGLIVSGNTGIGNSSPTSLFSVGSSSQFQVNSTGNVIKVNNVTTNFPSSQGAASTVLTNDGSGNLSWAASAGATSGKTYVLPTPASSDPNTVFAGTYTETGGEVTVTIVTTSDVIKVDACFSAVIAGNAAGIRVTRSQTAGSGTVGTVVGYSGTWNHDGTKYASVALSTVDNSFSATGTWYYKFWILTGSISSGANYNMVLTRGQ